MMIKKNRNQHAIGNKFAKKEEKSEAVLNIRCTTEQKNRFVKAAKKGNLSKFIIETIEKRVNIMTLQDKLNAALETAKADYIEFYGEDCNENNRTRVSEIGLRHYAENDAWEIEIAESGVKNSTRYFEGKDAVRIFENGFTERDSDDILISWESEWDEGEAEKRQREELGKMNFSDEE